MENETRQRVLSIVMICVSLMVIGVIVARVVPYYSVPIAFPTAIPTPVPYYSLSSPSFSYQNNPNPIPNAAQLPTITPAAAEATPEVAPDLHAQWLSGDTSWTRTSRTTPCSSAPVSSDERIVFLNASFAQWTPAQQSKAGALYVISADASTHCQLTPPNTALPDRLLWTPDGEKITLVALDTNNRKQIYTVDQNTLEPVAVTDMCTEAFQPDWSPDGMQLVFMGNCDNDTGIFVVNADKTGLTKLAEGIDPRWSPNGDLIAYVVSSGQNIYSDFYVMDKDGGNPRIVGSRYQVYSSGLTWDNDSKTLFFSQSRSTLISMDIDTGNQQYPLVYLAGRKHSFQILPDQRRAMLSNHQSAQRWTGALFILSADETTVTRWSEFMDIAAFDWYMAD